MTSLAVGPTPDEARRILQARARDLARPALSFASAVEALELLEFRLARERYALPTSEVREVRPLQNLTALPCTPPFVMGLVNVRGRIVPVIDIKKFLGLPEQGLTDLHRVILVGNESFELGILADAIVGVETVASERLHPAPVGSNVERSEYVKGVTAEHLILLDVARIVADPAIIVHEEVNNP
jgi:purine-binding chemotaxis protein CheW